MGGVTTTTVFGAFRSFSCVNIVVYIVVVLLSDVLVKIMVLLLLFLICCVILSMLFVCVFYRVFFERRTSFDFSYFRALYFVIVYVFKFF